MDAPWYLHSVQFGPGGWPMLGVHCEDPSCYLGSGDPEHPLTLSRSDDAGATTRVIGRVAGVRSFPVAITDEDVVIEDRGPAPEYARSYRFLSSGTRLTPPASLPAAWLGLYPGPEPRLLWYGFADGQHWYDQAGNVVVGDIHPSVGSQLHFAGEDGTMYFTAWERGVSGPIVTRYLLLTAPDLALREAFVAPSPQFTVLGEVGPRLLLGSGLMPVPGGWVRNEHGESLHIPFLIDLDRRTVHRLRGFLPGPTFETWMHAYPSRVFRGPFLRVNVGAGECLNVRGEASTASAVVVCSVDGLLLRERRESHAGGGWLAVTTPDGRDGFVREEYVVR